MEEIDRFQAKSDDGETYTVVIYQQYADGTLTSGPRQAVPTTKVARLLDGRHLRVLNAETFKIVATDQIIRKI